MEELAVAAPTPSCIRCTFCRHQPNTVDIFTKQMVRLCHHPDNKEPEVIDDTDAGSCKGFQFNTTRVGE